jgi:TctA family transporter
LGPMLENTFRQSLLYGDPAIFFTHPISAVLLCASLFLLISPFFSSLSKKRQIIEKVLEESDD